MDRSLNSSRRSFLKTSGLAIAGAVAGSPEGQPRKEHAEAPGGSDHASRLADLVSLVNLLQGTDSTRSFSRGNTLPIAARPFGMAHWTLQSAADFAWMFDPGERRIQGFRSTHQLSPWLSDYGQATFLPFCGEINPDPAERASSYRPEEAVLSPHSMRLHLMRYGIDAELVPTERCALVHASFSKQQVPGFLFDVPAREAQPEVRQGADRRSVMFASTANSGGVPPGFATYYAVQFSQPWERFEVQQVKGHAVGLAHFSAGTRSVDARIATSFISYEQAQRNLEKELGSKPVEALRGEGAGVWNRELGRIEIEGGTEQQQRTFYSCFYRALLFPHLWHEPDASGAMQHRSAYTGAVVPGVMYADHGYWDVYRAWYPLMTALYPERLGEILQAWVNAYKEGGWLPQFPCPGYRACMTGSLIDSVFGDAAAKGIGGFDLAAAYEGLHKHATQPGNPDAGYGRRGIEEYLRHNYCPADRVKQSAAETVDAAYGDFCIAQVAKALGKDADHAMFMKRSENWRNLFDAQSGFFRGKKADGSWLEPFDPVQWGDPYVEGSAWQHRWDVPHNFEALTQALGGREKVVAALEQMLTMAPDFNVGIYGQEIHEMSEMAAVNFGQYAQSNQPVHHVLYLFTLAGRRDRTAYWAHKVMDALYTPDVFPGDEDTGSMAAWYLLSSMGFYPSCPGKAEYTLGAPFFPRITVHLPQDKTLVIESTAGAGNTVTLNGKRVDSPTLTHAEVIGGGRLRFS